MSLTLKRITGDFTVSYRFEIEYDEQSDEFQNALDGYRTMIDKEGDIEGMLNHCLFNYCVRQTRDIEGVGVIEVDGESESAHNFSDSGIRMKTVWEEEVETEFDPEL